MDSQTHVTGRKPQRFRRPLHSFSLRAMLVSILVVGAGLGLLVLERQRIAQRRVQDVFRLLGAQD